MRPAKEATSEPQRYLFKVELADDDRVIGWVIDQHAVGRPPWIQVSIDGMTFATFIAADAVDSRALDLEHCTAELAARFQTQPQIPAGFCYQIPTSIPRGAKHRVEVTVVDNRQKTLIFQTESTFAENAIAGIRSLFSEFRFFSLDEVEWQGGNNIECRAWCSVPEKIDHGLMLSVNGEPVQTTMEQLPGPPDPQQFTFWPERPTYALTAKIDLAKIQMNPRGYQLAGVDAGGQRYFPQSQDFYIPPYWKECLGSWPLPRLSAIERVTPWVAQRADQEASPLVKTGFLLTGYTDIWHIDDVLSQVIQRSIRDMGAILDWGCGCGRLAQHLVRLESCDVHGADIDPENVAWANENIPGASFAAIGLDPPLPYSDGQFDLVIGISVFTHLTEADQFAWLSELRRVLKPGGTLAVTVAGHNALKKATLPAALRFYRETSESGFSDRAIGNTFDHLLKHRPAYYRNTRHLAHYIRREWARYFEIKAVVPAAMAGQQDLVVGTKLK